MLYWVGGFLIDFQTTEVQVTLLYIYSQSVVEYGDVRKVEYHKVVTKLRILWKPKVLELWNTGEWCISYV